MVGTTAGMPKRPRERGSVGRLVRGLGHAERGHRRSVYSPTARIERGCGRAESGRGLGRRRKNAGRQGTLPFTQRERFSEVLASENDADSVRRGSSRGAAQACRHKRSRPTAGRRVATTMPVEVTLFAQRAVARSRERAASR